MCEPWTAPGTSPVSFTVIVNVPLLSTTRPVPVAELPFCAAMAKLTGVGAAVAAAPPPQAATTTRVRRVSRGCFLVIRLLVVRLEGRLVAMHAHGGVPCEGMAGGAFLSWVRALRAGGKAAFSLGGSRR